MGSRDGERGWRAGMASRDGKRAEAAPPTRAPPRLLPGPAARSRPVCGNPAGPRSLPAEPRAHGQPWPPEKSRRHRTRPSAHP